MSAWKHNSKTDFLISASCLEYLVRTASKDLAIGVQSFQMNTRYYIKLTELTIGLYGAESFLTSRQSLSCSRFSQHFMDPEGSLLCSHNPPVLPLLSQINPVHTTLGYLSKVRFNIILPPTSRVFLVASFHLKTDRTIVFTSSCIL
jgi:hypothetical protein